MRIEMRDQPVGVAMSSSEDVPEVCRPALKPS